MSDETASYVSFECPDCHGLVEMPAPIAPPDELHCPHCGHILRSRPPVKLSAKKITLLIAVILCVGAVGAGVTIALKYATTPRARPRVIEPAAVSPSTNGFTIFALSVERQGALRYALGTASNQVAQQRFGVRIQLELLDTNEWRVGTASDYRSLVHSNEVWRFRALVVEPRAVSASLISISEEQ